MTGIIMLNPQDIKNWMIMMSEIIFFMSRTCYTLVLRSDGVVGFLDLLLNHSQTLFHLGCIVGRGFQFFHIPMNTHLFILQFEWFIIYIHEYHHLELWVNHIILLLICI